MKSMVNTPRLNKILISPIFLKIVLKEMCSTREITKKSPAYHHIQFHCGPSLQNDQLLHPQPKRKSNGLILQVWHGGLEKKMSLTFEENDGGHKISLDIMKQHSAMKLRVTKFVSVIYKHDLSANKTPVFLGILNDESNVSLTMKITRCLGNTPPSPYYLTTFNISFCK